MTAFIADPQQWAESHFSGADLGDPRRSRRLVQVASALASDPSGSLPSQNPDWGDLKAAYRLLAREEATFQAVCQPHSDLCRSLAPARVLILADTTEVDFGKRRRIEGLGPLGNGSGKGFLLHSGLLVDPDTGALLGLAGARLDVRVPAPKKETYAQRMARRRETDRWGELVDQVGPPPAGSERIHVMDRESDNWETFAHIKDQGCGMVARARCLTRKVWLDEAGKERRKLAECLAGLPAEGTTGIEVPAKGLPGDKGYRPARTAKLVVRFGTVWVPRPAQSGPFGKSRPYRAIKLNVVQVKEESPPAGQAAVEWVPYTTLPAGTLEEALAVVGCYRQRWLIEEWHKAIKTGTQVQARQLQDAGALAALVGISAVVAIRLIQLKTAAREEPARPAREVVPERYVRMAEASGKKKRVVATVREFFRAVARLGGFLGRKGDGEPGWQTIWRGWEKLALMLRGAEAFAAKPAP